MPKEVEAKYLIESTGDLELAEGKDIAQGYLNMEDPDVQSFIFAKLERVNAENLKDYKEARIRDKAGKYYLTLKGSGGLERSEEETQIDASEFEKFWEKTTQGNVEKTRQEFELKEGLKLEIDTYHGKLNGLLTAEVEFDPEKFTKEEIDAMVKERLKSSQDITEVKEFKNKNLAKSEGLKTVLEKAKEKHPHLIIENIASKIGSILESE